MIDETHSIYYISYVLVTAALGISYLKVKSTEVMMITTKEFRNYQNSFLTGYSLMILCETLAVGSFYHTFATIKLSLEQITKLYIVTIISSTVFTGFYEIIDLGSRKNKCIISAVLYSVAMSSVFFDSHFDLLLMGRVIYGAASALHHSSFEAYSIHQHASLGFPDDWLTQTINFSIHATALMALSSGTVGQLTSSWGPHGTFGFCAFGFALTAIYLFLTWSKDVNSPKFALTAFLQNTTQTLSALRSSRPMLLLLGVSTLCETAVTVFSFYWAPWLAFFLAEPGTSIPYEIVFACCVSCSILGSYLYQLYVGRVGPEPTFQAVLLSTSGAFFLGAMFQSPPMAFAVLLAVYFSLGGYWPSVGYLRGRFVVPELRGTTLTLSRAMTTLLSVLILSCVHHSPPLLLATCALLVGGAAGLHGLLTQREEASEQAIGLDDDV